jgi:hypothetical protein
VMRSISSQPDDTVPAGRPITVRDLLTYRMGFGTGELRRVVAATPGGDSRRAPRGTIVPGAGTITNRLHNGMRCRWRGHYVAPRPVSIDLPAISSDRRTCSRSTSRPTLVMSGRKKSATVQSRTMRSRLSQRGIWNR